MTDAPQAFERFKAALRLANMAELVPFIDMYLVRFPDRAQAAVMFDALCKQWAAARGLVVMEAA